MKAKNKKSRFFYAAALLVAIFSLSGCVGGTSQNQVSYTVPLEIWVVNENTDDFNDAIAQYKNIHPYIGEIKVRKFNSATYNDELLNAMASGNGPDIFMAHNTWVSSLKDKITEAPTELLNQSVFAANFVDGVVEDFADEGKIYGAPLSMGSLALYYNKDIFNTAAISKPPATWQEFDDAVLKTTIAGKDGVFAQSGTAMGTAGNVNRAADILTVLMMQGGAEMINESGSTVSFDQASTSPDGQFTQPGRDALSYFAKFSAINSPTYCWNLRMKDSIDAFAEGKVAMMINYPWQVENIKSKNPKLNFAVANLPQLYLNYPKNYSNYWGFVVSKNRLMPKDLIGVYSSVDSYNTIRRFESWQFLKYLTMKNEGKVTLVNAVSKATKDFAISYDPALEYLKKTQRPAARKDILDLQKNDLVLAPFAYGNFLAKNWRQTNPVLDEQAFLRAIDSVSKGESTPQEAIELAANTINNSLRGGL